MVRFDSCSLPFKQCRKARKGNPPLRASMDPSSLHPSNAPTFRAQFGLATGRARNVGTFLSSAFVRDPLEIFLRGGQASLVAPDRALSRTAVAVDVS